MRLLLSIVVLSLLVPGVARAEERRSPAVAASLSIGGTVASAALLLYGVDRESRGMAAAGAIGMTVAPSLGPAYAGKPLTIGLGLRVAGLATLAGTAIARVAECPKAGGEGEPTCEGAKWDAAFAIGGALFVGGTIADFIAGPRAARAFNERQLAIVPVVTPSGGGVSLSGAF